MRAKRGSEGTEKRRGKQVNTAWARGRVPLGPPHRLVDSKTRRLVARCQESRMCARSDRRASPFTLILHPILSLSWVHTRPSRVPRSGFRVPRFHPSPRILSGMYTCSSHQHGCTLQSTDRLTRDAVLGQCTRAFALVYGSLGSGVLQTALRSQTPRGGPKRPSASLQHSGPEGSGTSGEMTTPHARCLFVVWIRSVGVVRNLADRFSSPKSFSLVLDPVVVSLIFLPLLSCLRLLGVWFSRSGPGSQQWSERTIPRSAGSPWQIVGAVIAIIGATDVSYGAPVELLDQACQANCCGLGLAGHVRTE